ncbi:related to LEA domain protein [Fusarium torulosum]|uniref:Related to LEA domain protein n=1 Tax=Fusarium torulosum TaxID=33205 RepID=A0AAE8SDR5_9HYPO|nr:related to LEA domain protein [Fusarium torulosum]
MSFLTQNVIRRVALAPRVIAFQAPRSFTTSFAAQRTATDAVKETAKKVDRVVSDKIVDGIETGETVAAKAKDAAKNVTGGDIAAKAQELKGEAASKAQELKGEAAGKAQELKGEAKGTAEQAKGKAQELKGEAKGSAEQAKGKAKGAAEQAKHKL